MFCRAARLFLAGCLALPVAAFAQAPSKVPWTVTLTPQSSPLQLGQCSRIDLTINDPETRYRARAPDLDFVRTRDFDFTASTPGGAAVVTYSGEYVYACACLAGTPGTSLTATATYPRQKIAASRRARGVAFQKSVDIPLVPSRGSYNPPECAELAASPRQPSAPVFTVPTPEPAPRRTTAAPASVPPAPMPVIGLTPTPAPVVAARGAPQPTKRSIAAPPLSLTGIFVPKRSIAAPPLSLAGIFVPKRSIATPPLNLAGIFMPKRSITAPPLNLVIAK